MSLTTLCPDLHLVVGLRAFSQFTVAISFHQRWLCRLDGKVASRRPSLHRLCEGGSAFVKAR